MSDSIPEYYRHLAEKKKSADAERDVAPSETDEERKEDEQEGPVPYRADAFRMMLPSEKWQDRSLYTLTGPTIDGIQHNITINVEDEPEAESLDDFAVQQIDALGPTLDGCRVLMDDAMELACGLPAHRAIFVWTPEDDLKLYQEQIYALHDGRGYTLTSSFTRKTRKRLGPEVERMMRSFQPG